MPRRRGGGVVQSGWGGNTDGAYVHNPTPSSDSTTAAAPIRRAPRPRRPQHAKAEALAAAKKATAKTERFMRFGANAATDWLPVPARTHGLCWPSDVSTVVAASELSSPCPPREQLPSARARVRRRDAALAAENKQDASAPTSAAPTSPIDVVVLWFRQDLRLDDNPALVAAAELGVPIVPIFVHDSEAESGGWPTRGAGRFWLDHALDHLRQSLVARYGEEAGLLVLEPRVGYGAADAIDGLFRDLVGLEWDDGDDDLDDDCVVRRGGSGGSGASTDSSLPCCIICLEGQQAGEEGGSSGGSGGLEQQPCCSAVAHAQCIGCWEASSRNGPVTCPACRQSYCPSDRKPYLPPAPRKAEGRGSGGGGNGGGGGDDSFEAVPDSVPVPVPVPAAKTAWACGVCTLENDEGSTACLACGSPAPPTTAKSGGGRSNNEADGEADLALALSLSLQESGSGGGGGGGGGVDGTGEQKGGASSYGGFGRHRRQQQQQQQQQRSSPGHCSGPIGHTEQKRGHAHGGRPLRFRHPALFFNRLYEPWKVRRDAELQVAMHEQLGVTVRTFQGSLLYEPWAVRPDQAPGALTHGFGSLGFFRRAALALGSPGAPLDPPTSVRFLAGAWPRAPRRRSKCSTRSDRSRSAHYPMPRSRVDGSPREWGRGILAAWKLGEAGARATLRAFVQDGMMENYEDRELRMRADMQCTGAISPYMRFGELSPRRVVFEVQQARKMRQQERQARYNKGQQAREARQRGRGGQGAARGMGARLAWVDPSKDETKDVADGGGVGVAGKQSERDREQGGGRGGEGQPKEDGDEEEGLAEGDDGGRVCPFLRKLLWRDLAYWMMWFFPRMAALPLRHPYDAQWWAPVRSPPAGRSGGQRYPSTGVAFATSVGGGGGSSSDSRSSSSKGRIGGDRIRLQSEYDGCALRRWQLGQTGFPLVDAGMRQLWLWGWMPNYVRHICAQFLVEYLGIDWRHGEAWFHDTLVDADVAINAFM